MPLPLALSSQSRRTGDSPITHYIQKAIQTPGLISLAAGLVDESALPADAVRRAADAILTDPRRARVALQYGSTQGSPELRAACLDRVLDADRATRDSLSIDDDCVVITTGSQQMLYLLGEVLFDPGDIVICEAPSYFVYHDCLKSHGAVVHGVPMDSGGMSLVALEQLLEQLKTDGKLDRVKLIYTVDYHQNPTGLSLAAERRPRLVELARRYSTTHRILVLEDAAYRELRYSGEDVKSIKSYDVGNEFVVYTTTFSKPCAPGLKTGYSLMPRELVAPLCNLKGGHDFGSTNLAQQLILEMMRSGDYDAQVDRLRQVYRVKRDAMLEAIQAEFQDWPEVRWTRPDGGLYVWMTFPPTLNVGRGGPLIDRALAEGVLYIPGELGHVPDEFGQVPTNEARLSFGVSEPAQITEGIRRLRRACRGLESRASRAASMSV